MIVCETSPAIIPDGWLHASNVIVGCLLLFCGVLAAQDLQNSSSKLLSPTPASAGLLTQDTFTQFSGVRAGTLGQAHSIQPVSVTEAHSGSMAAPDGPRRITLDQAKQQAATQENPMAQLGQFQVEAAKQHRLGAQTDYFPKVSSMFINMHFNKFMGLEFTVQNASGTAHGGLPLAGEDQTVVAVTAAQPVTPLFKIREEVRLARADENIARAKAGMPVTETSANVERGYYGLLVAERQLSIAKVNAKSAQNHQLLASNAAITSELPSYSADEVEVGKALVIAESKVKELMASLNLLLGYPAETELELVPPATQFEDISLKEASDKAMVANPEVVEAEQNVVKARAGAKLSKLDYVPDFVVLGGYTYQDNAIPLLPRDFSFIGVMGSWNVFDFGKREHTVKERRADVEAAELALQLTKAKVTAALKSSYFELDRSRQLSELTHRIASTLQTQRTRYSPEDSELTLTKAKLDAEMFQADLSYRQSLARLKTLMGEQ